MLQSDTNAALSNHMSELCLCSHGTMQGRGVNHNLLRDVGPSAPCHKCSFAARCQFSTCVSQ